MELYHALNRRVDGRTLFTDKMDYARFVHDLWEFNDITPVENVRRRAANNQQLTDFVNPSIKQKLVEIHGWCLMKNHYHLLLSELVEGGISLFLRKVNVGYANYFNERHERQGTLFQGRTKKILIKREAHFLYILHYVHLNPLDYLKGAEDWRERSNYGIRSARAALKYLEAYPWSSYLDYSGAKNFPSILTVSLFADVHGNYKETLIAYLADAEADFSSPGLEY